MRDLRILLGFRSYCGGLWWLWLLLLPWSAALAVLVVRMPLVEKWIIDDVVLGRRVDLLAPAAATYAGLWLVVTIGQGLSNGLQAYIGERLMLRIRSGLFDHCERLSVPFVQTQHTGRTLALFAQDVPSIGGFFSSVVVGGSANLVGLLVAVVTMVGLSWELTLVAGIAPPIVVGLGALVTRPLRPAARAAQQKVAELIEHLQENLAGIREVIAFGGGRSRRTDLAAVLSELLRLRMRVVIIETSLRGAQSTFLLAVRLTLLGFGGYLAIRGDVTLGTLVAMQSLVGYVFQPATELLGMISGGQKMLASAERVHAVLAQVPSVREREGARPPRDVRGEISFRHVGFAYRDGSPVLRDVSFTARPGEMIALVGPSGAGKSTLTSLVARFHDPADGQVMLDGVDLRDLTLEGLREQIGMVFQDTFLFAATVRENIAFGSVRVGEAEIVAAARAANAWEFIERLPDGLDTQVGERGVRLSEGQKQRLAIARALLRQPRILILDEPTSALDARSEHLLQVALENLMHGRTTFVIAHRLATVRRADQILVLDQGRIVERGTHESLLSHDGLYRELFDLQFDRPTASPSVNDVTPPLAMAMAGAADGR
jgi:ATP-binding cassette, subfamily B, bacterial MsbA